jgi:hypothetical protein
VAHASLQTRHQKAVATLSHHDGVRQPEKVVESLSAGLSTLRKLFLTRIHDDVEAYFGIDSMLAPMTESEERKELHLAKVEIEVYNIAVVAQELREVYHLDNPSDWACDWLLELRLGDQIPAGLRHRLDGYLKRTASERRMMFAATVEHALPEAMKAPLVIYRLYPRAIRVALAIAFGDPLRAAEQRNEQLALLPAIGDCDACHGRALANGEVCSTCGNPLWKIKWLSAAD